MTKPHPHPPILVSAHFLSRPNTAELPGWHLAAKQALWVGSLVGGVLADWLHHGSGGRRGWSNVAVRRFMVVLPQLNYAFCGVCLASGAPPSATIGLLVLSNFFEGFVGSGLWIKCDRAAPPTFPPRNCRAQWCGWSRHDSVAPCALC